MRPSCADRRTREAHPVHRRVQRRPALVEQVAVLDEQQRLRHHRRHRGEVGIAAIRVAEVGQRSAAAVEHIQAGTGLLAVRRKQAAIDVVDEFGAEAGLRRQLEAARLQPFDEIRQFGVAEALVEGAVRRVAQGLAAAGDALVVELRRETRDLARLQARAVQFVDEQHGARHQYGQYQDEQPGTKQTPGTQAAPDKGSIGFLCGGCFGFGIHIRVQGRTNRYGIATIMRFSTQENDTVTEAPQSRARRFEAPLPGME